MKDNLFVSHEYANISIIFTNFVSFERFYFTKGASHLTECSHVFFATDKDDIKTFRSIIFVNYFMQILIVAN